MPGPKVFVSSTAYDLATLRGQLRGFIEGLGFEPALSEHSDVLYDPRIDTQLSCIKEIPNCDMLVVIVGSRFGSAASPSTASAVDFDAVAGASGDISLVQEKAAGTYSITQLEVLSAIVAGIPVFAFVDHRVMTEHDTYQANRDAAFLPEMRFGSIDDAATARYIFEFIAFLRERIANNALFTFSSVGDIQEHLTKQWSSLFQRLLSEERAAVGERQQIDRLQEQFDNLQTAILASIGSNLSKEVARGVVSFRYLVDVLMSLGVPNLRQRVSDGVTWAELLELSGVMQVDEYVDRDSRHSPSWRLIVRFSDGSVKAGRISSERWSRLEDEWSRFVELPTPARLDVFDALSENSRMSMSMFRSVSPDEIEVVSDASRGGDELKGRVVRHQGDGSIIFESPPASTAGGGWVTS
jgi:hypothetical protein